MTNGLVPPFKLSHCDFCVLTQAWLSDNVFSVLARRPHRRNHDYTVTVSPLARSRISLTTRSKT